MSVHDHLSPSPAAAAPAFRSILCGVDGGRADATVAEQAALLAGSDARLELIAVSWEIGTGMSAQAALGHAHADAALDAAAMIARDAGAAPVCRRAEASDPAEELVAASADHDLLVLGASGVGRLGGIALGRPGTVALHRAACAVLLARPTPAHSPFPSRILLADDGRPAADDAARIAATLAARHGATVVIAAPTSCTADERGRLAAHSAAIVSAGAPEPLMAAVSGAAHEAIPELAREHEAALIVLGSRRLHGARALRSVSERVAHAAPCSVLVARGA